MTPTVLALLQEAEGVAPKSPFEPRFGIFFWTILVFVALFFLLRKFAWPAILQATEEREQRIKQALADAERMNAESKAALEEHKKLLAGAKSEAMTLLNDAKIVAQKEREQALAKTRAEQDAILERAKREIQAEKDRAAQDLRREAVDLSLAAASKLIEQRLDNDANRKLVTDYLGTLDIGAKKS
jgi:F-type H+-transporting ATPase subunit b